LVRGRLASWDGEAPGLSRGWVEQAVAGLGEADPAAARLALLAALASYQVDNDLVAAFQQHYPDDDTLVATLAWASFTAVREVALNAASTRSLLTTT
jgi:hypothetical protein